MARELSARERRFLLAGAAALALFLALRLVGGRLPDLGLRARRLLPEKTAVLLAYREAVGREAALEQEAERLGRELESYREVMLPSATPPLAAAELQTRLKELADRAGLRIQSEKILPHARRESFLEIPVQIVANGDIKNLRDFIVAVESGETFIAIKEMSLRSAKRRQFVPETRAYVDLNDIQANLTMVGLIPG